MERLHPNPTVRLSIYVAVGLLVFVALSLALHVTVFSGIAIGLGGALIFTYVADPTNPHTRHRRR